MMGKGTHLKKITRLNQHAINQLILEFKQLHSV